MQIISVSKKHFIQGVKEIYFKAIHSYDFYSETKDFVYDSIGFESIYGLFNTYDDLFNADRPRQVDKTNEQLMTDTLEQLWEKLKDWKDKMRSTASYPGFGAWLTEN